MQLISTYTYHMKKIFSLVLLGASLFVTAVNAQKKVAVVTFNINKQIDVTDFGAAAFVAVKALNNDPNFDLSPLLTNFHTQFFDDYSKNFPFELLPETTVFNNEGYKTYVPIGVGPDALLDAKKFIIVPDGYKIILDWAGHADEKNMLKIFSDADGVMDVSVHFKLVKISFAGVGIAKVNAEATIMLFNKNGDKVFSIDQDAKSKSTSAVVGGVPVMSAEKILPMCQSAMETLMASLQKDLPKMIKKADAKL